jgi:photosystem II stability/assembly factor-like uncharacterized protein
MRVLLVVLATAAALLAQPFGWDVVNMAPGIFCNDMQFLADGQHGWVVGAVSATSTLHGQVLATTDGGSTWNNVPYPESSSVGPEGVYFVNADTGWIVGAAGYISATHDGGFSWTRQTSPVTRKLHRVQFINSQVGWITGGWQDGSSYPLLKTTNGGANWQDLSFGSDCYSCEDLWFADSLNGWVVGQNSSINPFIQHTTDGGASWNAQTAPLPTGNGTVSSVCFATPKVGWASVSSIYQSPAGSILHTTNGGDSWYVQANTNMHYNYFLDAPDTLHVAVVSTQVLSPAGAKVFVSTNGGSGWSSTALPTYEYAGGCQYRGSSVWVAQNYGQVLHSSDNGSTWDWQHYAPMWNAVGWRNDTDGWVIAGSSAGVGYAMRTTDGGLTWNEDSNCPGGTRMQWVDQNHGFTLMEGNSAKLYRTTDGGANWAQFSIGGSNWIGCMCFASPESGWACGSNGTLRFTSNGGASWSVQSSGVTQYLEGVFMVSTTEGWIYGGYGGAQGFIRHTTDGGLNWVAQSPSPADHFACGYFFDNKHGWLGTYNNNIHATTDGGSTWQVMGQVAHTYHDALLFTSSTTGWIACGDNSDAGGLGYVLKTTNAGISWTPEFVSPWPSGVMNGLALKPDGSRWACGMNATLIKNTESGVSGAAPLLDAQRITLDASPNPFHSTATIHLSSLLPAHSSLQILDASGRLVRSFSFLLPPHSSLTWDGTDATGRPVTPGVYFCRLVGAGRQAEVKLVRTGKE